MKKKCLNSVIASLICLLCLKAEAVPPAITATNGILYKDGQPCFLVGVFGDQNYIGGFSFYPSCPGEQEYVDGRSGNGVQISFPDIDYTASRYVDFSGFDSQLCYTSAATNLSLWVKGDGSANTIRFVIENYIGGEAKWTVSLGQFPLSSTNWTQFNFSLEGKSTVLSQANVCYLALTNFNQIGFSFVLDDIAIQGPFGEIILGNFDNIMPVSSLKWSKLNERESFSSNAVYQAIWNDALYKETSRTNFEVIGMDSFHLAKASFDGTILSDRGSGVIGDAFLCGKLDGMPMVPGFSFDFSAQEITDLGLSTNVSMHYPNGGLAGGYDNVCLEDPFGNKIHQEGWQMAARNLLEHGANIYAYELINENSGYYVDACQSNRDLFISRLQTKYGNISNLSQAWGTNYTSFEAVAAQISSLGYGTTKIKGLTVEWNKFMEDRYVETLQQGAKWIREVEDELSKPHALMGHMGYPDWEFYGAGGSDIYKKAKNLDLLETESGVRFGTWQSYIGETNALTLLASSADYHHQMMLDFADAVCTNKPIISTENYIIRNRGSWRDPTTKADIITSLWEEFVRGLSSANTFAWAVEYLDEEEALARGVRHQHLLSPYLYPREALNGYKEVNEEISRVADVVMARPRLGRNAACAVLFSRPSVRYFIGSPTYSATWKQTNPIYRAIKGVYDSFMERHIPLRFVYEEQLPERVAEKYRVLLAPYSDNIYTNTISDLTDYVEQGHTLICFGSSLRYDEYGNENYLEASSTLLGVGRGPTNSFTETVYLTNAGNVQANGTCDVTPGTGQVLVDFPSGKHFITRRQVNETGAVYYVNADASLLGTNAAVLLDYLAAQVGLTSVVEIVDMNTNRVDSIEANIIPQGDNAVAHFVNWKPYLGRAVKVKFNELSSNSTYHVVNIVSNSLYAKNGGGGTDFSGTELKAGINLLLPSQERVILLLTTNEYSAPNAEMTLMTDGEARTLDTSIQTNVAAIISNETALAQWKWELDFGITGLLVAGDNDLIKGCIQTNAGADLVEVSLLKANSSWEVRAYGLREGADTLLTYELTFTNGLTVAQVENIINNNIIPGLTGQFGATFNPRFFSYRKVIPVTRAPRTHYVRTVNPNAASPYTNWAMAATNIADAVAQATVGGDIVLVTNGTYLVQDEISPVTGITIRSVTGSNNLSAATNTIIKGGWPNTTNRCLGLHYNNIVVEGLTITNGRCGGYGGGINMTHGTLRNCIVSGNTVTQITDSFGGGIYASGSDVLISNCIIRGNTALGTNAEGGGAFVYYGKVLNSTVSGNRSPEGGVGGITLGGSTGAVIQGCVISNNTANYIGGARTYNGILRDSVIVDNTCTGSGGGVSTYLGGIISNCTIRGNTAGSFAGGLYLYGGVVKKCAINWNTAPNGGAGVYLSGGAALENSVITGNRTTTDNGGGVRLYANTSLRNCLIVSNSIIGVYFTSGATNTLMENCTIVSNTAGTWGGGVYWYSGSASRVVNSIIHSNTLVSGTLANWDIDSAEVYFTNSCTYPLTGLIGSGNISSNPAFINAVAGNYRLATGSACLDSGTNQNWMAGGIDLDNNLRIQRGVVDMGAYENDPSADLKINPMTYTISVMLESKTNQILQVWNGGTVTNNMIVGLSTINPWLTLSATNLVIPYGQTNTVVVTNSAVGLGKGTYTGTVTVVATNGILNHSSPVTQNVTVVMNVGDLQVNPSNLTDTVMLGSTPSNRIFKLINTGAGSHNYTVTTNVSWLRIVSSGGGTIGNNGNSTNSITIGYQSTANWTPGTSNGMVLVKSGNVTQSVAVTVNTIVPPDLQLSPTLIYQEIQQGGSPSNQAIKVWNGSQAPQETMSYTITPTSHQLNGALANWLGMNGSKGESAGETDTVSTAFGSMSAYGGGTYTGLVTVVTKMVWPSVDYPKGYLRQMTAIPVSVKIIAPRPVGWVTATKGWTNGVVLTWEFMSEAASYKIWRSETSLSAQAQEIGQVSTTNYTDNTAVTGVRYYYWVRVVNSNSVVGPWGASDWGYCVAPGTIARTYYVRPVNTNAADPYTNWATAATNIADAVNKAKISGDVVLVTNGTYTVRSETLIWTPITVRSVNGAINTIVNGNWPNTTNRCFYLDNSNVVVEGFTITNACAGGYGGGGYINHGTLRNCIVSGNTVTQIVDSVSLGGGLYAASSDVLITNCVIRGNTALGANARGGGISMSGGGIISNCTIQGNTAGYVAGGIYLYGGVAKNCAINGNTSAAAGGVYLSNGGMLEGCIISGNRSTTPNGGGVRVYRNTGMRNCLIVSNSIIGVYFAQDATNTFLENCTIVSNTAGSWGGGVYWDARSTSVVVNTIIHSNTLDSGTITNVNWSIDPSSKVYFTNCCTYPITGLLGTNNISSDPMFVNPAAGNYRLLLSSPCVNSGTNLGWMASGVDVENHPRIQGEVVDRGAYENQARTYYVRPANTNAADPYTNWARAATNIADAVAKATTPGDVVLVTNGTYVVRSQISPASEVTIRSVNGAANTIVNGNWPNTTNRCFYLGVSNLVVEGFTITNACYGGYGGGVHMIHGTLRNCIVSGNTVTQVVNAFGGGIYAAGSDVIISNCIIRGNTALGTNAEGAGVFIYYGKVLNSTINGNNSPEGSEGGITLGGSTSAVIQGCVISNNMAKYMAGVRMYTGVLRDSVIVDNVSTGSGGGVSTYYGGIISNCTIKGNASGYSGGGLYLYGGVVNNCVINDNTALSGAGVYLSNGGMLEGCIISGNRSTTDNGGGVRLYRNTGLRNCLIVSNSIIGVYFAQDATNTFMENCTIVSNTAGTWGGGVYWDARSTSVVVNTIIHSNTLASGSLVNWSIDSSAKAYFTNCCTYPVAGLIGSGNISSNPAFVNAAAGNYRLATGSTCINSGTNQDWMTGGVDLDGNARIQSGIVDRGAYERGSQGMRADPRKERSAPGLPATGSSEAADQGYSSLSPVDERVLNASEEGWFGVMGQTDVAVSNLVILPNTVGVGSSPAVVSMRLWNKGPGEMRGESGMVGMSLYISGADEKIIPLGTVTQEVRLVSGMWQVVSVTNLAALVFCAEPGDYVAFMVVEPSRLADTNLVNNTAMRSTPIHVSAEGSQAYVAINDYDGDGISDLVVYREGLWYVRSVDGRVLANGLALGRAGYKPVFGDYDADKRADPFVYLESNGVWQGMLSGSGYGIVLLQLGGQGARAMPADMDGDGKLEPIVYQEGSGGAWESAKQGLLLEGFGAEGYAPVAGDYDGDGKWDMGLYDENSGAWYIMTMNGEWLVMGDIFGGLGVQAVPGDYDGDGKWDLMVYEHKTGKWSARTTDGRVLARDYPWGTAGLLPVYGDYDGDGCADLALYHEGTGNWYILSPRGEILLWSSSWGAPGYRPVSW